MADAAGRTNAQPFTAESNYRSTIFAPPEPTAPPAGGGKNTSSIAGGIFGAPPARVPASEEKFSGAYGAAHHGADTKDNFGAGMTPDASASRPDLPYGGYAGAHAGADTKDNLGYGMTPDAGASRPEGFAGTYGGAHAGADTQAGLGPGMVARNSQSQVVGTRAAVAGKDTQDDGLGVGMLPREGASRPEDRRKARTEFGAEKGHAPFGRDDQLVE